MRPSRRTVRSNSTGQDPSHPVPDDPSAHPGCDLRKRKFLAILGPKFPPICLGLALAGSAVAAEDTAAVVRLTNNERIAGTLASLAADQLVWKSPVQENPTPYSLKNILDLTQPAKLPESAPEHETTLTLTNGDTVRGKLTALTGESLTLDTWFAGRLTFKRTMVAAVKMAPGTLYVYRGPTGLDGWRQTAGKPPARSKPQAEVKAAWSYGGLAFRSSGAGTISRDDLLPDECSISFDMAWTGNLSRLKVIAFADTPSSNNISAGYEFLFEPECFMLTNLETRKIVGYMNYLALPENRKARIEIRAGTKSGKLCLLVNDCLIQDWVDPDIAKCKFGRGLQFVSMYAAPIQISRIAIAPWNGDIEHMPGVLIQPDAQPDRNKKEKPKPLAPVPPREGRMELMNGDSVEGEALAINDGVVTVQTPLGKVGLPVERFRTIVLKKADPAKCPPADGDIRAWFPDGSYMVFRLIGAANGSLTGSSPNFGTATFQLAAFNFIEFNIHDPAFKDQRAPRE